MVSKTEALAKWNVAARLVSLASEDAMLAASVFEFPTGVPYSCIRFNCTFAYPWS